MCGILGIVGALPAECDAEGALDQLSHRGPDDRGMFADEHVWLGHRRLSIIDLGPGGHQPMVEPESGVVITYNGEIYNYVELRRELEAKGHAFRSTCDTEVLLHSYLEWGAGCVDRFNGMWGFLLWDPREGRAFFARDRFGVKPFCYAMTGGLLAVASEPKALAHAFSALREVDTSAMRDLLLDRREHHDERTFYAEIKSLPAGHRGTFGPGDTAPRIERYWHYPDPRSRASWDEPDALQQFSELIGDAVKLRLRSDVPVGITISGGVDSTAILDAMAAIRGARHSGVESYTAIYPESEHHGVVDERRWAMASADRYPNVSLTAVQAPRERWLDALRKITWHMDGPTRLKQVFPMWMIMERARADGVPVLLEGQGADEVFGGYAHHAALGVIDRLLEGPGRGPDAGWSALAGVARAGTRAGSPSRVLKDMGIGAVPPLRVLSARRTSLRPVLTAEFLDESNHVGATQPTDRRKGGRVETRLHADFSRDTLPGLLRFGDSLSMAHSIEVRLPFMDYRVVEFGITLPPAGRIGAGETKHLLREHLRAIGQREIADRGQKQGFPTPALPWLAAEDGAVLREVLLDRDARIRAIVDAPALERTIARHIEGRHSMGEALYALLTTELWWQQIAPPV
jgi:asparagine synthase (glutamine-hydrolysing)